MNRRFVFDTNTIISAALFRQSTTRQALDKALTGGILLASEDTIIELTSVFLREKFDRYLHREIRELFLTELLRQMTLVAVTETFRASRDTKDDKFLEVAVSGQASAIVTGDKDLLVLHPFRNISIISPKEFITNY